MVTITLTEFNRHPSRATAMARREKVVILNNGVPEFTIEHTPPPRSGLARLVAAGAATPPRDVASVLPPPVVLDVDIDAELAFVRGEVDGGLGV